MSEPAHTFVGTADNFQQLVLGNSARGPVLVNYWSPRAGPCMMPVPDRLTAAYGGRFLLVNVNVDDERPLVRKGGVNSVPTLLQRIAQQAPAAEALAQTARGGDLDAAFQLAAVNALRDDVEGAMEQLLAILQQDAAFDDGAAHRSLLGLFQMLGSEHELVRRYRPRLLECLDSGGESNA